MTVMSITSCLVMLVFPLAFSEDCCNVLHVGSDNFDDVFQQCQSPRPQRPPVAACIPAGRCPVSIEASDLPDSYSSANLPFTNLPDGFDHSRACGKLLEVPLKIRNCVKLWRVDLLNVESVESSGSSKSLIDSRLDLVESKRSTSFSWVPCIV